MKYLVFLDENPFGASIRPIKNLNALQDVANEKRSSFPNCNDWPIETEEQCLELIANCSWFDQVHLVTNRNELMLISKNKRFQTLVTNFLKKN
ncbi:hypothetical protein AB6E94_18965 [Vibrio lentus]|uniref:hypothetical protein n=1 Tax=Vibrio TaxID=662 RepID=UPI000C8678FE|nr:MULTISPECIES: hypothetical protein [Vibrio]MCC4838128.1 hypothetical protein [Vibrio lentus]PMG17785.1 hypothetical protein BCU98_00185 [Vibrio splendidus]